MPLHYKIIQVVDIGNEGEHRLVKLPWLSYDGYRAMIIAQRSSHDEIIGLVDIFFVKRFLGQIPDMLFSWYSKLNEIPNKKLTAKQKI